MCGKVLWSFIVVSLLPNDCIPTFWKVHDTRQVCRTVELSDWSGNGSRKVFQRRETHTTHVDFQFWERIEIMGDSRRGCRAIGVEPSSCICPIIHEHPYQVVAKHCNAKSRHPFPASVVYSHVSYASVFAKLTVGRSYRCTTRYPVMITPL